MSEDPKQTAWNAVGQHAGYGLTIAASLGFFMAVGWWLDGRLGIRPVLTILGALLGAAAGFYSMWVHLVVQPRESEAGLEEDSGTDIGSEGV
jgi:hypothetical protein